ncbi:UNVERIFIED_CONTAM: hypothetical protein BEN50_25650, partial [Euhalothece sp. KZN 001]
MPEVLNADQWEAAVLRLREQKDRYFADDPHSPMPPDQQGDAFPGLSYFAYDPAYRVVTSHDEEVDHAEITVETTADGKQSYRRAGRFTLAVPPGELSLSTFAPLDDTDRLWVPFRDATSGESTYGAGRYLDLRPD